MPKYPASRIAVSAVIERLPFTTALMRFMRTRKAADQELNFLVAKDDPVTRLLAQDFIASILFGSLEAAAENGPGREAVQRLVLESFSERFHDICASVRTALQNRPTEMYLQ